MTQAPAPLHELWRGDAGRALASAAVLSSMCGGRMRKAEISVHGQSNRRKGRPADRLQR